MKTFGRLVSFVHYLLCVSYQNSSMADRKSSKGTGRRIKPRSAQPCDNKHEVEEESQSESQRADGKKRKPKPSKSSGDISEPASSLVPPCKKSRTSLEERHGQQKGNGSRKEEKLLKISKQNKKENGDKQSCDFDSLDVSSPERLLSSLLSPEVSLESFFEGYWEKKPLVVHRGGDQTSASYYGVNFTREALFQILSEKKVDFLKDVNVCRYVDSNREELNKTGRATAGKIRTLFDQKKATLQFHQPQRFQDKLWQICELLESFFNSLVGANIYMTPGGSQGLAPHYDDVEVLILQLEGRKHWRLYAPPQELPRDYSRDLDQDDIGLPTHDFILETGDFMYFPRGTVHQADTPDDCPYSTHVTISTYQRSSFGDVLMLAIPNVLNSAINNSLDFRKGVPVDLLTNSDTLSSSKSSFQRLLGQLSNHIGDHVQQAANQMVLDFVANRLPPFKLDHADSGNSLGQMPTETCKVRLKFPKHVFVMTETEDEEGEEDDDEEGEDEEDDEDDEGLTPDVGVNEKNLSYVVVRHSLNNTREEHMMSSNQGTSNGLRLPVLYHKALNQLKESTAWLQSKTLKLPKEDTKNLLMSLWAEGLLEVSQ
ncbi:ribosomal oxygenase 2-like isoform X2 [Asterias rubens]|uniref:ribosomal oxygenase 2-like isoform X2 n=1 Tax=Asterias rubens TaxID=7604 RepID=UPI001455898B|nr:ribosomal oxygenase 2-like isoform X2 [Asterias rubens]